VEEAILLFFFYYLNRNGGAAKQNILLSMNWPWNLNNEQHRWREAKEQWFKTLQSRAKKGAGGEKEGGTVDMFLVTCDNRKS
jgi:hypothetical protein